MCWNAAPCSRVWGVWSRSPPAPAFRPNLRAPVRRGFFCAPPHADFTYHAFIDPSGGRHDVFALAIGHKDGELTVIDVVRGRAPPFNPTDTVQEYAALLREYRCLTVVINFVAHHRS